MRIKVLSRLAVSVCSAALCLRASGGVHGLTVEQIHPPRATPSAFAPDAIGRACAIGYRKLESGFQEQGLVFDHRLVTSHKGSYCHIYFKPSWPGFRAARLNEPVRAVFYDPAAAGALAWARAIQTNAAEALVVTPVESITEAMPGAFRGKNRLLLAYSPVPDAAATWHGLAMTRSKLGWRSADLQVIRDPQQPARRLLLYGDSTCRTFGRSLKPEECAYVLRAEFGVDEAIHVPSGPYFLSDVLIVASDRVALAPLGQRKELEALRALGFTIGPLVGVQGVRNGRQLLLKAGDAPVGTLPDVEVITVAEPLPPQSRGLMILRGEAGW